MGETGSGIASPGRRGNSRAAGDEGARAMAKGQKKSNKEIRKPKKEVKKVIAANPSTKGNSGLAKS